MWFLIAGFSYHSINYPQVESGFVNFRLFHTFDVSVGRDTHIGMDLRKRFGNRVAAQRHRLLLTQAVLADAIEMSPDMISRIETGATGVRFATIEKLADALLVDPSFFFSLSADNEGDTRPPLMDLVARLSKLDDADLKWVSGLLNAALASRNK